MPQSKTKDEVIQDTAPRRDRSAQSCRIKLWVLNLRRWDFLQRI
jgi:hypothetical protein